MSFVPPSFISLFIHGVLSLVVCLSFFQYAVMYCIPLFRYFVSSFVLSLVLPRCLYFFVEFGRSSVISLFRHFSRYFVIPLVIYVVISLFRHVLISLVRSSFLYVDTPFFISCVFMVL